MGRPKLHDEATRARLLLAAEAIAEGDGLGALSLRRLAAETGLSTRAVYSTFGSKDGLIDALGALAFDWLKDQAELIPETGDPGFDLVQAAVHVFRRLVVERTVIFQIGFQTETRDGANPLIREAADRALPTFTRRVARIVPPEQVRDAVLGFDAICEGLAALELRGNFEADRDPDETWRSVLSTYVAGLARHSQDTGAVVNFGQGRSNH
jgi:AcrR family transcriptional regulator